MTKSPMPSCTKLLGLLLFSMAHMTLAQSPTLKNQLDDISDKINGKVGVSIISVGNNDTLSLNGNERFPMQSVFKFHIALAALRLVDEGQLSLDQKYRVTRDHYFKTWSVLMREYPDADVDVTLRELLTWTVKNSDNAACDIVFDILGGPEKVNTFIETLGITDIAIVATEREMHQDWNVQFSNWTTPNATARLLKLFEQGKILTPASNEFLWKLMAETPNAPGRLKGLLPKGTVVARKPGTGDTNGEVYGAVNDVGILVLPNGKRVVMAVFVTRVSGDFKAIEQGIAEMSRSVYDYYLNDQPR